LCWCSVYGFNPGSALILPASTHNGDVGGLVAVNTALSAAGGAIAALLLNLFIRERLTGEVAFDLRFTMNGCLGGLAASTGISAACENWAALVTGLVAGMIYLGAHHLLIRFRIDDAVDAIPVHLSCGAWGIFACGLFASPARLIEAYGRDTHVGLVYELRRGSTDFTLLGLQCIELLFVFGWVTATMLPFFHSLNWLNLFRVDHLEEAVGLDATFHNGSVIERDEQSAKSNNSNLPLLIASSRRAKAVEIT
jgi:ammonium transporter, Amt family